MWENLRVSLDIYQIIDANCILIQDANIVGRAVKDAVKQNPIKSPTIEKVTFQLRKSCIRIDLPVLQANRLRDIPQFDVNKRTAFFVAGWFAPPDYYLIDDLVKAYNCRSDYNFVVSV